MEVGPGGAGPGEPRTGRAHPKAGCGDRRGAGKLARVPSKSRAGNEAGDSAPTAGRIPDRSMPRPSSRTIADYGDKRDFRKTPEPQAEPGPPAGGATGRRFVVHRHEARRLHYDLRLEMEGVLRSWAVPKGFTYDPEVKKLAVRTEDHPLAYTEFEGVIPEGEYGGGTMTRWDRGRYEITEGGEDDGAAGVRAGKLVIRLRGRKLRGAWHLVRTTRAEHEWLLFKGRDRYARKDDDRQPFFELAAARRWTGRTPPAPLRPIGEAAPFSDPAFLFEPELAGLPVFLARRAGEVRLAAADPDETGFPSGRLPELLEAGERVRAETFLAHGVLVATDAADRPSVRRLAARFGGDERIPVVLYLNDLLRYEEWDIRGAPLRERKALLSTLLPPHSLVLFGDHVAVAGEEFHAACEAAGLPGSIARRADASWPGDAGDCLRIPGAGTSDETHLLVGLSRQRALREAARPVRFTNLDKIFWPDLGYTKGDLIRYYDRVAEHILPYLRERPSHLLRTPDGVGGKAFYQKDLPDHTPEWVETEAIPSGGRGETIRYLICNDASALLYAANLGSIDIHPWLSRRTRPAHPDWVVFDLDPGDAPFSNVVRLARAFGKVLRGIGLRPSLKTSGATGLHIHVPLEPIYPYRVTRQFAEAVSTHVAGEHREIATVERQVARRGGRVYLDFLQNRRGQTIVPPYAVRPVPAASVSTPLDWDELDGGLDPSQFTLKTLPDRVERLGDLFAGTLHDRQHLLPAIRRFEATYLAGR